MVKFKSDAEIQSEFDDMIIHSVELNTSRKSGYINVEFPVGGEHTAGGCSEACIGWIRYDDGRIALDNWFPETSYLKVKTAIEDTIAKGVKLI